ncbi:MAG: cell envelope integrity protein TolA [Burkholderiaceae bacterium]
MKRDAPYSIPSEPGRWRAIILAVLVHLALLAFLWIGVRWQSETPAGVEAEIWSPQNREAAPASQPPPQKQPEPQKEPPPPPKPAVQEPPPKPPVAEPARENPDIALEQEKKRKEQERREAEQEREKQAKLKQEREERERAEKQKQLEQQRAEKEKQEKLERQKAAEEKARKEKEEQEKKLAEQKAAAAKAAAEKKRKEQEEAAADKRRQEDLQRMQAQAGTGGSGSAATTQGSRADSDYAGKVGAKIRSNTVFNVPDNLGGNPEVEFAVELLPDGSIRSLKKLKSSGVPGFDEAVQRAIARSAPFPPDKTGKVPSGFNVIHRPKDQ